MVRKFFALLVVLTLLMPGLVAALDTEKLLKLEPLPSVRYQKIGENIENSKELWVGAYGLLGGWMCLANLNKGSDAYHVNNILSGSTFLVTAAFNYMTPNSYLADQKLFVQLDLQGEEKEKTAYFQIKSEARDSLVARQVGGLMYLLSGLTSAVVAGNSPGLTANERSISTLSAVGFIGLAVYQFLSPSEIERTAQQIDLELAQ